MPHIQKHLLNCLRECAHYHLTPADELFLSKRGLEKFIFKKITSKKFRKWSLNQETVEGVRQAININFANNKPIQLVVPFGGYKMWHLPSAPEVDWAEFFSIAYYCNYLAPILTAYEPGAVLYFSSDEIVIEKMNNIPKTDTDKYHQSFEMLLECFRRFFPHNLKIEIKKIGELYGQDDFDTELKDLIKKIRPKVLEWGADKIKQLYQTSLLNFKFDGVQNFSALTDEQKQKKIEEGFVIHEAYRHMSQKIAFVYEKNKIVIAAKPTVAGGIGTGTTKNSIVKFWSGTGVLETMPNGQFANRILSYQQWQKIEQQAHKTEPIYLVPLKNFKNITAFPQTYNFSQRDGDGDLLI